MPSSFVAALRPQAPESVGTPPRRRVLFWVSERRLVPTAATLAELIHARAPQTAIAFVDHPDASSDHGFEVIARPLPIPFLTRRFVAGLRPQTLVLVGAPSRGAVRLTSAGQEHGASVLLLVERRPLAEGAGWIDSVDAIIDQQVVTAADVEHLLPLLTPEVRDRKRRGSGF